MAIIDDRGAVYKKNNAFVSVIHQNGTLPRSSLTIGGDAAEGTVAPGPRNLQLAMGVPAPGPAWIKTAFSCLSFSAIYLQKISIPGLNGKFGLDHIILWGMLLWLVIQGAAYVQPLRFLLYLATTCAVIISLILEQSIFSIPALVLFLSVNGTVLFVADVDHAVMLRCYMRFQTMMVPIACIIIGQQAVQYTIGHAYWPDLNNVLPRAILVQGFTYIRPLDWRSSYLVPNGVFFLEPSAASWFIAVAAVIEIIWLKRFKYRLCSAWCC
jgi:hypothetical protein